MNADVQEIKGSNMSEIKVRKVFSSDTQPHPMHSTCMHNAGYRLFELSGYNILKLSVHSERSQFPNLKHLIKHC